MVVFLGILSRCWKLEKHYISRKAKSKWICTRCLPFTTCWHSCIINVQISLYIYCVQKASCQVIDSILCDICWRFHRNNGLYIAMKYCTRLVKVKHTSHFELMDHNPHTGDNVLMGIATGPCDRHCSSITLIPCCHHWDKSDESGFDMVVNHKDDNRPQTRPQDARRMCSDK